MFVKNIFYFFLKYFIEINFKTFNCMFLISIKLHFLHNVMLNYLYTIFSWHVRIQNLINFLYLFRYYLYLLFL